MIMTMTTMIIYHHYLVMKSWVNQILQKRRRCTGKRINFYENAIRVNTQKINIPEENSTPKKSPESFFLTNLQDADDNA